ncbi:MAG: TfoX/Sxy family protein [Oscillospiraceae bacterium]|nr:TfoX/Sxy family protein [Oscillospiraceae bacterium]
MPSDKEYLDRALAKLEGLGEITHRQMMGEYMIYCRGKLVGGVYDNRLLLKRTPSSERILAESECGVRRAVPYDGAKEQLDFSGAGAELVRRAAEAVADELPAPKRKK